MVNTVLATIPSRQLGRLCLGGEGGSLCDCGRCLGDASGICIKVEVGSSWDQLWSRRWACGVQGLYQDFHTQRYPGKAWGLSSPSSSLSLSISAVAVTGTPKV